MKFCILMISLLLINCQENNNQMKITYYKDGKTTSIDNSKIDYKSLFPKIKKIAESFSEALRVYTDEERINLLKSEDEVIEIHFTENQKVTNLTDGEVTFNRLLIPLTGDFSTTEEEKDGMIFIGLDEYDASPYLLSDGRKLILSVRDIILK